MRKIQAGNAPLPGGGRRRQDLRCPTAARGYKFVNSSDIDQVGVYGSGRTLSPQDRASKTSSPSVPNLYSRASFYGHERAYMSQVAGRKHSAVDRVAWMRRRAFLDPSAFFGTDPTGELITSGLLVTPREFEGKHHTTHVAMNLTEFSLLAVTDGLGSTNER